MITIADYGVGNLAAVVNMMRHIGVHCQRSADPEVVATAEKLILPGIGHFDHCAEEIDRRGLREALTKAAVVDRKPLLGICVGAQLLGGGSAEGQAPGLGWLDMWVDPIPAGDRRVPRMGWGELAVTTDNPLLEVGSPRPPRFYFAHSFCMRPNDASLTIAVTTYGSEYAAAVQGGNIVGVQFHPEKSHVFGMDVLRRFAAWTP